MEEKLNQLLKDFKQLHGQITALEQQNNNRKYSEDRREKAEFYNYRKNGLDPIIETLEYALNKNAQLENTYKDYIQAIKEDTQELERAIKKD